MSSVEDSVRFREMQAGRPPVDVRQRIGHELGNERADWAGMATGTCSVYGAVPALSQLAFTPVRHLRPIGGVGSEAGSVQQSSMMKNASNPSLRSAGSSYGDLERHGYARNDGEDIFSAVGGLELGADAELDALGADVASTSGHEPHSEPSRTLFVRHINPTATDEELLTMFKVFGEVRHVYSVSKHRGFVMVTYYDLRAAARAQAALHGAPVGGAALDVHFCAPKGDPTVNQQEKLYALDAVKIRSGEDRRTTLMIKNIPNKYTQKMLLATIDEQFRGVYDFFYLPIDFKNKCNVGYAFINLINPFDIIGLVERFNHRRWERFNSEKVCSISYARIQGRAALVAHFQNSSLMHEDKRCRPILFTPNGTEATDPEAFQNDPSLQHPGAAAAQQQQQPGGGGSGAGGGLAGMLGPARLRAAAAAAAAGGGGGGSGYSSRGGSQGHLPAEESGAAAAAGGSGSGGC
ncbi:Protein MEI2-like 2 [Tetrabaena socialis]|uniref:Protein MEI2-like 2 n=1 Tax=Tetrabaena socialis TaxID=47790 RepID=A0A2J8A3G2_9CHLO|nr:Protein MEI2-like 2 [Tetrabaena socialis]|eukprot:PNH07062.1 Protein MEI2-like 2 [Tetrabaena socialis]